MRCFQSRAFVAAPSVQLPPSLRPTLRMVPRTTAERGGDARVSRLVPWVFRNEVSNFEELRTLGPALLVNVENADGHEVGVAVANLQTGGTSSINVLGRMLADNMNQTIDPPFFTLRIKRALQHRERVFQEPFYRLLNGEGDQVPGVVCDRYGDVLCVQFMAAAMQLLFEDQVCDALAEVLSPRTIIVRCDPLADRRLELAPMALPRVVRGTYEGPTVFLDSGFTFHSDLLAEHWSSGRYFAERDARTLAVKLAHELSSNGSRECDGSQASQSVLVATSRRRSGMGGFGTQPCCLTKMDVVYDHCKALHLNFGRFGYSVSVPTVSALPVRLLVPPPHLARVSVSA